MQINNVYTTRQEYKNGNNKYEGFSQDYALACNVLNVCFLVPCLDLTIQKYKKNNLCFKDGSCLLLSG